MGKLKRIWQWLANSDNRATVGLIGGGLVTVVAGAWALYIHFYKLPSSEIKPLNTGVQIGGSITAGHDVVIQNIQQNIQLTGEQFAAFLNQQEKEKVAKIPQAGPEQRALLEKELAKINADKENLQKAYEEQKARLAEAYKAIDNFKRGVPPDQVEQARKDLAQGQTRAAEDLFRQAMEKNTGPAAEAAYQLGLLAEGRIDYGQAERYYLQALKMAPDNSTYFNAAGELYLTLGRYAEGEPVLKRALELREKSLDPGDQEAATSLNNLAVLYRNQGKYSEAEPLHRRALAIREEVMGPEHPDVAQSLNNLAELYRDQGKYSEAERLHQRALAIREKSLGPEHPDVAISLNNLAAFYWDQEKYSEAEPLYRRALAIFEKALGPEHPDVALSLNNLAALYRAQRKYSKAEPLYRRALAILEKALGPEHPNVATCLGNYARLLKEMGRGKEAEPLEARAKAIRAKQAEKNPSN